MSAPDTNVERQEDQHKPSLLGIKGALAFGVAMVLLMVVFTAMRGEAPTEETVIGTEEVGDDGAQNGAGVAVDPSAAGTNQSN